MCANASATGMKNDKEVGEAHFTRPIAHQYGEKIPQCGKFRPPLKCILAGQLKRGDNIIVEDRRYCREPHRITARRHHARGFLTQDSSADTSMRQYLLPYPKRCHGVQHVLEAHIGRGVDVRQAERHIYKICDIIIDRAKNIIVHGGGKALAAAADTHHVVPG